MELILLTLLGAMIYWIFTLRWKKNERKKHHVAYKSFLIILSIHFIVFLKLIDDAYSTDNWSDGLVNFLRLAAILSGNTLGFIFHINRIRRSSRDKETTTALSQKRSQTRTWVLALILGLCLYILFNWNMFQHTIRPLLYRPGPALNVTLENFNANMREPDVLREAAIPLLCMNDNQAPQLGDRVCFSNISSFMGIHAFHIAFFFKHGNLASIKVDVPWWLHSKMGNKLISYHGKPRYAQNFPIKGVRLVGWKLEFGSLIYNGDQSINPLMWNTIAWFSNKEIEKIGGKFIPINTGNVINNYLSF